MFLDTGCSTQSSSQAPIAGWYHRVRQGESIQGISLRYGCDPEVVRRLNSLPPDGGLYAGQLLFIPVSASRNRYAVPTPTPLPTRVARAPTPSPGKSPAVARVAPTPVPKRQTYPIPTPRPNITPRPSTPEKTTASPNPTKTTAPPVTAQKTGSQKYILPVQGTITRRYSKNGDKNHNGIDFAAPEGTYVVAARAGKVIYSSGKIIPGFGNMIIIDHLDGYTTLYAHNKENLVSVNQTVKQGQRIARVGHTGKATGDHLHFEIRYKAEPVDPGKYLDLP